MQTITPTSPHNAHRADADRYEIIAGRRVELPPMGIREAHLATVISAMLFAYVRPNQLGEVFTEALFRIDPTKDLERRPDVAFVSAEKWPMGRALPNVGAWEMIPDLAVEVVSPSNTVNEVQTKLHEYFHAGVRQVWVVHLPTEEVYVYATPTQVRIIQRDDTLDAEPLIPGFRLALRELFRSAQS